MVVLEVLQVFSQDRVRRLLWIVHTPAGRGVSGGLQGFHPRRGMLKRTAEEIADIPVPGGLRHDFLPDPHPSPLPADLHGEPNQGFFRTFHRFFFEVRQLLLARGRAVELIYAPASGLLSWRRLLS